MVIYNPNPRWLKSAPQTQRLLKPQGPPRSWELWEMGILRLPTLSSPASSGLGTVSLWSVGVVTPLHNGLGFATQMFLSLFSGVSIMIAILT